MKRLRDIRDLIEKADADYQTYRDLSLSGAVQHAADSLGSSKYTDEDIQYALNRLRERGYHR